jgi:hypothetical protein
LPEEFPLSGTLLLSDATQAAQGGKARLEIKAISNGDSGADPTLLRRSFGMALVCLVAAAVCAVAVKGIGVLGHRMGEATWSFDGSWSSTLTIGGSMLTALVTFSALPEQGHLFSRRSYMLLSLLFAGLIGLAPGVYNLFRKPLQVTSDTASLAIQYQGLVCCFFVAGVFTMTGVFAQLALLQHLLADLATGGLLSTGTSADLRRVIFLLQGVLWAYAFSSAALTAIQQSTPSLGPAAVQFRKLPSLRSTGASYESADPRGQVGHALPKWRLL